jgi:hypothetical protein
VRTMSKAQSGYDLDLGDDNRRNHPWEYPNCPECHRHIFVDRHTHDADFICYKCGTFDQPSYWELREELR